MKYLKSYNKLFESVYNQFLKTKEEIENWLEDNFVKDYIINDDLTVDINSGTIRFAHKKIEYLPFQFGFINGNFNISNNKLKTLKGSPLEVKGDFNCSNNNLTSLEFCPKSIDKIFYCSNNKLTSLEFCPSFLEGLYCFNNNITSLKGYPSEIQRDFIYYGNPIDELLGLFPKKITTDDLSKTIKYLNDYDVIQGNIIYLDRLKEALYMGDINNFDFDGLENIDDYTII